MEQTYAEATAKRRKTPAITALKVVLVFIVVLLLLSTLILSWFAILGVAAAIALIWYWPRFNVMWEYVYCDGQLDFDQILGGEKRKTVMRVEIEEASIIAPANSDRLGGYAKLPVKNYSSLEKDADVYAMVIRPPKKEDQVMFLFEPGEKMVDMMHAKCPNIVFK